VIVSTEAIVLHAMKYGETSKIVTLYTRLYGKQKVIAKGVRTAKNRVGASLEPMTIASAVFYKKQNRDLSLLSKCEIAVPLKNIFSVEEKMIAGLALIELLSVTMHEEHEDEPVFLTAVEALREIDRAPKNPLNVFISFVLGLIHRFGYSLTLDRCMQCGAPAEETKGTLRFQLSEGTVVCQSCAESFALSGMPLSLGALKSLQFLMRSTPAESTSLTLSTRVRDEVLEILFAFMKYHIAGMRTLRTLSLFYT
jgi:DNA repair protein RecO (recombination protein O)